MKIDLEGLLEILAAKKKFEVANKVEGDACFSEFTYMDGRIAMLEVVDSLIRRYAEIEKQKEEKKEKIRQVEEKLDSDVPF